MRDTRLSLYSTSSACTAPPRVVSAQTRLPCAPYPIWQLEPLRQGAGGARFHCAYALHSSEHRAWLTAHLF